MTNLNQRLDAHASEPRRWSARASLLLGVIVGMLLMACDDDPTAPKTGSLKVSVETVGGDFDQDGYSLVVGSGQPMTVSSGTIVLENISAGAHVLTLSGLADNCTLAGTPSRSITVPSGGTADVKFAVTCDVTGIEITTRTTGPDQPPGGYVVETGGRLDAIAATGNVVVGRLAPGTYTVSLRVADNCSVTLGPSTVNVSYRAVTQVTFEITCVRFDRPIAFQRDTTMGFSYESAILLAAPNGLGALRVAVGNTPAWSPDGKRLAYSNAACDYYYGLPCTGGVAVLNLETLTESVPSNAKLGVDPSWSPDGKQIAFIRIGPSYRDNSATLNGGRVGRFAGCTTHKAGHFRTSPVLVARRPAHRVSVFHRAKPKRDLRDQQGRNGIRSADPRWSVQRLARLEP